MSEVGPADIIREAGARALAKNLGMNADAVPGMVLGKNLAKREAVFLGKEDLPNGELALVFITDEGIVRIEGKDNFIAAVIGGYGRG
jgi:hypothetical protein